MGHQRAEETTVANRLKQGNRKTIPKTIRARLPHRKLDLSESRTALEMARMKVNIRNRLSYKVKIVSVVVGFMGYTRMCDTQV